MKYKMIVSAVMAALLTTGGWAFAQDGGDREGRGNGEDRGRNEHSQRGDRQERRDEGRRQDGHENRGRDVRADRHDERGAGPNHAFHRGERLPVEYRRRQYVIDDWRGHHLSAPPRGYQWVQTGGDYVLVAIASGIILQLFLN